MAKDYLTEKMVEILESDMDRKEKEYKLKRLKRENLDKYFNKRRYPDIVRNQAEGEIRKV